MSFDCLIVRLARVFVHMYVSGFGVKILANQSIQLTILARNRTFHSQVMLMLRQISLKDYCVLRQPAFITLLGYANHLHARDNWCVLCLLEYDLSDGRMILSLFELS
jgi:hypothetical protein